MAADFVPNADEQDTLLSPQPVVMLVIAHDSRSVCTSIHSIPQIQT